MCGGFEQYVRRMQLWVGDIPRWNDDPINRLNIRPTMTVGTIDAEGYKERSWSLIPKWAKTPKLKYSTFNARGETLHEKPVFKGAWAASQRCLIPASAYFEWTGPKGNKQCHAVMPAHDDGLCFAGLWEVWARDGERRDSCTIVTVAAHESIAWLHHRMPLMLDKDGAEVWLAGAPEASQDLISPALPTALKTQEVGSPRELRASA